MSGIGKRLGKLEMAGAKAARIERARIYTSPTTGHVHAITMQGVLTQRANETDADFEKRAASHFPRWMTIEAMTDDDLSAALGAYREFIEGAGHEWPADLQEFQRIGMTQ